MNYYRKKPQLRKHRLYFVPMMCPSSFEATTHIDRFTLLKTPEHHHGLDLLLLLGCLLLLLLVLFGRRRLDVLLHRRRHRALFLLLLLLFLSKHKREALLFLEFKQDMLCKTALALGVHAQEQVRRHVKAWLSILFQTKHFINCSGCKTLVAIDSESFQR